MSKKSFPKFTTAPITASFIAVDKPVENFNKDGQEFKVSAYVNPDDAWVKALVTQAEQVALKFRAEFAEEKKKPAILKYTFVSPIKPEVDRKTDEPTGKYLMNVKSKASYVSKGETMNVTINVFDAGGNLMNSRSRAGSGTVLRISGVLVPYAIEKDKVVGVTLRLNAVQIINLVPFSGGNSQHAADHGFDAVDGFTAGGEPDAEESPAATPSGSGLGF